LTSCHHQITLQFMTTPTHQLMVDPIIMIGETELCAQPNLTAPLDRSLGSARFVSSYCKSSPIQYLNYDQRPTLILDLKLYNSDDNSDSPIVFINSALLASSRLYDSVRQNISTKATRRRHEDEPAFAKWIAKQLTSNAPRKSSVFFDTLWTLTTVPESWAVISGVILSESDLSIKHGVEEPETNHQQQLEIPDATSSRDSYSSVDAGSNTTRETRRSRTPLGDMLPPSGLGISDHIAFIRNFDWASTSLGSIETWSPQLRQACEMMLANPDPATIFWGPDLILIYNESYIALAGNKHPSMMGGSARIHWKEVWDLYDPLFHQMKLDGKAFKQDNSQLFIHRGEYLEEGFFNMIVMPLLDDDGFVVGYYEPVSEVTKQTLSERRMHTLLKLSEIMSSATSLKELWRLLLETLSTNQNDVHFAVLYDLQRVKHSNNSLKYNLEGSIGLGTNTTSLRPTFMIDGEVQEGIDEAIRRAHASRTSVILNSSDGSLTPSIIRRIEATGIQELPRTCVVCPLSSSVDESVEAFLILGISPRRPYDEDYELFVNLLLRQVESTITFVKLFEKEKERLKQKAIYESELKFKQFAENAQVGIFNLEPNGTMIFCNNAWLELSGNDRHDMSSPMDWAKNIHPDNIDYIKGVWEKLISEKKPMTYEVQWKKPWRPTNVDHDSDILDRTWVVASAYAEVSEDGELTGILGCMTDISSFKWVAQLQARRLSEALELKRQQENFLDITSHEMRNPLNAILHCATELGEILAKLSREMSINERSTLLNNCLDSARTIMYCGKHQKRIIDDVLTLSKLDSNLLSISPVETKPLDIVKEVLKVFDTEIRASSIQTRTELADSYKALDIEAILIDPHRVIQILINLVANAIKFTKGESLRNLRIEIDASTTEPKSVDSGVRYVPSGRGPADPTEQVEWGAGQTIYVHFSVKDTGPGMTTKEADIVFNRFAQGSPRTHVQYGGSGLGLFISRELAELHGGRIGISSEVGLGSTFDFYVKGRRPSPNMKRKAFETILRDTSPSRPAPSRELSDESLLITHQSSVLSPNVLEICPETKQLHVLIVEDNLINQNILARLIHKQGYVSSIANHGEEALDIIQASKWNKYLVPSAKLPLEIDIVLADIEMPVMDGKEFVRNVRRLQKEGSLIDSIPVIAVTGNARNEQVQLAREAGFDDIISKPYSADDLISRIQNFTERDKHQVGDIQ
jgi:PAS domain S-box-containing protein